MIDIEIALQNTDGDREMLCQMAELFIEEGPKQLRAIETMISSGDTAGLRDAAHTLKGTIAIFGASTAQLAAARLEQMGAGDDLSDAAAAWSFLVREFQQLTKAMFELLGRDDAGPIFEEAS